MNTPGRFRQPTATLPVFIFEASDDGPAYSSRQGERSVHWLKAFVAHTVVLSEWHDVHALGILYLSVMSGVINRNV